MLKKILFSFLCLLVIYSSGVVIYRIYEPKTDTNVVEESAYLDYESLKEYVMSTGESVTHYLFFYSMSDNDCVYIKNTVMAKVQSDTLLQIDRIIETVDITALEANMTTARLSKEWGISRYPAFAAVTVEDGQIKVVNMLEYDGEVPLTALDIEGWLEMNGLISAN